MSFRVSKLARAHCASEKVGGAKRAVLLQLADAGRDDGISWESQETIAKRTVLTPEWVRKCIRFWEQAGVVETWKAHRKGRRSRERFNVYRIVLEGVSEPDYDRLESEGIVLEQAFTTGSEFRSSDAHDRNSVPPTTGTLSGSDAGDTFNGDPVKDPPPYGGHTEEPLGEVIEFPRPAGPTTAHDLTTYYVSEARARGGHAPPLKVKNQVAKSVKELLDEGIAPERIRPGLDLLLRKSHLTAKLLPQLVHEAEQSRHTRGLTPYEIANWCEEDL